MRSYNIETLIKGGYLVVTMHEPIEGNDPDFLAKLDALEEWANANFEGDYLFLLRSVIVKTEHDALIFKLKYG